MTESVVYGCIRDTLFADDMDETRRRRKSNFKTLQSLPSIEDWPLIAREMFSLPTEVAIIEEHHTDVTHFGNAYKGVEYEWESWIQQFEDVLRNMYWASAIVHLETEYNGKHTFVWEPDGDYHTPDTEALSVRCEWSREGSF